MQSNEQIEQAHAAWTVEDAKSVYGINDWGADYFCLTDQGEVALNIRKNGDTQQIPLIEIVEGLEQRGNHMPVLLRIENLLDDRIRQLNEEFALAIEQFNYQGKYRGVFPIKVNQQYQVIDVIAKYGRQFHHGLEAGSKAELIVAMAMMQDPEACIVCNGYKDAEFIELGLHARRLGMRCFFVIETPSEVTTIIEQSRRLGIEPLFGVRVKLSSKVEGHWYEDSGDRSLFGLAVNQLMSVVDELREADMLHCLQLLHYHIGSQIPNINNVREGLQEACRYYVDLIREGAPMGFLDLGGGLAVDYTGGNTSETHSRNYSLREYCVDVVEAITESLNHEDIPHPTIITESGRATVAYSSVLLFNILGVSHFNPDINIEELPEDCSDFLANLRTTYHSLGPKNVQESYNDAGHYHSEIRRMFRQGLVRLRELALAKDYHLAILQRCRELLPTLKRIPPELQNLDEALADIYYGNFSLFQSLPDAWAIDQVFPVMPIHRLDEEPSVKAIIGDITCDSDGKLDLFANAYGEYSVLPLHPLRDGEEYYVAVFLVGAYQETLGDLHNLFGDTHVVSVRVDDDGKFEFVGEIQGDTIGDVLSYVEYDPKQLYEMFRRSAEKAVSKGVIDLAQRKHMLSTYKNSLEGYTYFERD